MTTINCDMGEAFGLYRMGDDEALMPLISAANVACGFHASDFNHMRKTVRLAKQHHVKVGGAVARRIRVASLDEGPEGAMQSGIVLVRRNHERKLRILAYREDFVHNILGLRNLEVSLRDRQRFQRLFRPHFLGRVGARFLATPGEYEQQGKH